MRIYYIQWNSCFFDCKKYSAEIMSHAVLNLGGINPRFIPQYGLDNEVVAFDANPLDLAKIEAGLKETFGTEWLTIAEVYWDIKNN